MELDAKLGAATSTPSSRCSRRRSLASGEQCRSQERNRCRFPAAAPHLDAARGLGGDARALGARGVGDRPRAGRAGLRLWPCARNPSTRHRRRCCGVRRTARCAARTWRAPSASACDTTRCGRRWRPRAAQLAEYTRGGWTALHFAAAFGSAHVVEDLLALGASMAPLTAGGSRRCTLRVRTARWPPSPRSRRRAPYLTAPDSAGRTAVQLAIERADGRALRRSSPRLASTPPPRSTAAPPPRARAAASAASAARQRRHPRPAPTAAAGSATGRRGRRRRAAVRFCGRRRIDAEELLAEHRGAAGARDGRDAQRAHLRAVAARHLRWAVRRRRV